MKRTQKTEHRKQNALTAKEVEHVAKLASLHLTEGEVSKFQKQLSETLGYFKILNRLDTSNVKPTFQTTGLENVFRDDEVGKEGLDQKEALVNAVDEKDGFFKIKKIL